jgi:hypothetical protein
MDQYYEMGLTKRKNNHFKNKYSETQVNHMLRAGCPNLNSYYSFLNFIVKEGEVGRIQSSGQRTGSLRPLLSEHSFYIKELLNNRIKLKENKSI